MIRFITKRISFWFFSLTFLAAYHAFSQCPNSISVSQIGAACISRGVMIEVSGLSAGSYTIAYTIGGEAQSNETGVADSHGVFSFTTRTLTAADNEKVLAVTAVSQTAPVPCSMTPTSGNTVSLAVSALPTDVSVTVQSASVCGGTPANINVQSETGVNYQLRNNSDNSLIGMSVVGNGSEVSLRSGNLTVDAVFNVLASATSGCSSEMSARAEVSVISVASGISTTLEAICSETLVNHNVYAEGATSYIIAVNVGGLTQTSGTASAGSNKTSAELNDDVWKNNTDAVANVIYTVTPANGGCLGAPFTVTVPVKPLVKLSHVVQAAPVCAGTNARFHLLGLLPHTTFSLTYDINGGAAQTYENAASNGTGRAEIVIGEMSASYDGQTFSVLSLSVANSSACDATVSASTQMRVHTPPTARAIFAESPSVCRGASTSISVPFSETGAVYQLLNRSNNALLGPSVSGNGSTVSLPTGTIAAASVFFVPAVNSSACQTRMSNDVTVSVVAPAGTDERLPSVCSGARVNHTLSATGAVAYIISTRSNGLLQKSGTTSAGENKTDAELADDVWSNKTANAVNVVYSLIPLASNGCRGQTFDVTVLIHPEPSAGNPTTSVCSRETMNYSLQTAINQAGGNSISSSFTWSAAQNTVLAGASKTIQSTSAITDALQNQTSDSQLALYTVTPTSVANTCVGDPFTVTVVVNPEPAGSNQELTVCSGTALNAFLPLNVYTRGNSVRSNFEWRVSGTSLLSGCSVGTQGSETISDILSSASSSDDQQAVYSVTPTSAVSNCTGSPFFITVKVRPKPAGNNSSQLICSKSPLNINLQSQISNSVACGFSWYAGEQANIIGETVALSASDVISDVLENIVSQPGVVRYFVTPRSSLGCLGEQFNIDVTVNRMASLSAGSDAQICPVPDTYRLQGSVSYAPNGVRWTGGSGTFSDLTNPSADYTSVASEVGSVVPLTLIAEDPDGDGPCTQVLSVMRLKINPLPVTGFTGFVREIVYPDDLPFVLTGSQSGGNFTVEDNSILPSANPLSDHRVNRTLNLDQVTFTPPRARVDVITTVIYTFTDRFTGCRNSSSQSVVVRQPTNVSFSLGEPATEPLRFCANQGKILLEGTPDLNTSGTSSFVSVTGNNVVFEGGKYYFETTNLEPGVYRVKYIFDPITNSTVTSDIVIVGAPRAQFSADKTEVCLNGKVRFTDLSTVFGNGIRITDRHWDFGNPKIEEDAVRYSADKSTALVPYDNVGAFRATLSIFTNLGCADVSDETNISVRLPSSANFTCRGQCQGNTTKFAIPFPHATDTYSWDFGDGNTLELDSAPVPPEKSNNGLTSGTGKAPIHKYREARGYLAKLSVRTTAGCVSYQERRLNILKSESLSANSSYFQDFNSGGAGWVVEAYASTDTKYFRKAVISDTSWVWGTPKGHGSFYDIGDRGNLWWTGAKGRATYAKNENTAVLSPCFNLSGISSPMISLDYCVDTERDYDGAVLQYSLDDGAPWITVGSNLGNRSINWYNSNNINSKPGDQLGFVYGWTGRAQSEADNPAWKTAAFALTDRASAPRIRFRLAFGSNENDTENAAGFGFDNVFIGEKQRKVLIEHFTNNDPHTMLSDAKLNDLPLQESYLIDIRYHTQFPVEDKLYLANPIDPDARQLFYNINQPPFTLVNGKAPEPLSSHSLGDIENMTPVVLLKASLAQPFFSLSVQNDDSISENNFFRVSVRLRAEAAFHGPLLLQAALVEKSVKTDNAEAVNVVRKLLFGSEGKIINRAFRRGDEFIAESDKAQIRFPLTGLPGNAFYVAFVQDKNSKKIYQSATTPAPDKTGMLTTGFEDKEQSFVFPNPAKDYVLLPPARRQAAWTLADQTGRTVMEGEFSGVSDYRRIPLSLAQGVYILTIRYADKTLIRNKLMVR